MSQQGAALSGRQLVDAVVAAAQAKKAHAISVFEMTGKGAMSDWFVVCDADNAVHARAIADGIVLSLKGANTRPHHVEGGDDGRWVLVDYLDVVVHVMREDVRSFYAIEELWADGARRTDIPD